MTDLHTHFSGCVLGPRLIEIGLDVGYASPSHFAQVFRREVGVAPSAYRAQR